MRFSKLGLLLLPLLTAAPSVVAAQPSIDVNVNLSMPGEPIASTDVFYDQLSPYGVWVDDANLGGQVFIPQENNYVPYTNGHWEYTDMGFVWVSDEPFAWATSHYGRWTYSDPYNRWVWLPDTTWGPSWVEWYDTGSDFGWRPLAPQVMIDAGYQPPAEAWHFCPAEHILDVDLRRHYEPRERVVVIQREARPIQHTVRVANHEVHAGPPAQKLQEHRVAVQPKKIEPKKAGLMQQTELRAATERAKQRRPQLEAQNRKRVESNTTLREAEQRAKTRQPAKQTTRTDTRTNPPATTRTDTNTRTPPRDENRTDTRNPSTTPRTDENRTNTRTNPRDENRTDTRTPTPAPDTRTPRPEPRDENRTAPTPPAHPDTRSENRTPPTRDTRDTRTENRPDPRATPQPAHPEQRTEPRANPQPRPEQRAENRPEPKKQNDKTDKNDKKKND